MYVVEIQFNIRKVLNDNFNQLKSSYVGQSSSYVGWTGFLLGITGPFTLTKKDPFDHLNINIANGTNRELMEIMDSFHRD